MRECIRKHLEMFLLHHVLSMCIMLGFGRKGKRRSCLVAAENFFFSFFLSFFFCPLVCAWKVKIYSSESLQTFDVVFIRSERNCEK